MNKSKLDKLIFITADISEAMHKIALDDLNNSKLKNSPLASMAILDSLSYSKDKYQGYLIDNMNNFDISLEDVDNIIKKSYQAVYEMMLE